MASKHKDLLTQLGDKALIKQGSAASMGDNDSTVRTWMEHYPLPAESAASDNSAPSSRPHIAHRYRPPRSDVMGVTMACAVIVVWATLFLHALFRIDLRPASPAPLWRLLHAASVFFSLEFLYTGLFITTHDAMHGAIAYRHRRLNNALGRVAISLYAWFDYGRLHTKHWEHHNRCGIPHEDPDFHRGNPHLAVWYFRFMFEYMTVMQVVKLGAFSNALIFLGAPYNNILLFMTAAPLLSAFRLFYFGTYEPHRPLSGEGEEVMDWTKSRSSPASPLLSFLTCWCFGYHWEHHRWPYAPWWHLWRCKQLAAGL